MAVLNFIIQPVLTSSSSTPEEGPIQTENLCVNLNPATVLKLNNAITLTSLTA